MSTLLIAMDYAAPSVRRIDANGFMHVETSNISKANVCPYYGREIPDAEALGLDPDRIYYLYRHPDELAKAAHTFNNIPLLSEHLPVDATDLPEDLIIGSTGTDADFDGEYLKNSLVIWSAESQDGINAGRKKELSCGYRYQPVMTPGVTADGLRYDGVMSAIIGNHVALVIEGRAGPDVVVGDEIMKLKSRTALMISGALQGHIRPLLAVDAKIDLAPVLGSVSAKTMAADGAAEKLASGVAKLVKPHLAADKALDGDALAAVISAIQPLALDEDEIDEKQAEDEDEEEGGEKQAADADPDPEEAEDEDDDDDKKDQAMDAASVAKMIAAAETRGAQRAAAIEVAKKEVAPLVGEVIGLDSAEAIYKFALDAKEVSVKGVHKSAYRQMVKMLTDHSKPLAVDAAMPAEGKLAKIVPNLPPLIHSL